MGNHASSLLLLLCEATVASAVPSVSYALPQGDQSVVALSPRGKLISSSVQVDGRFGVAVAVSGKTVIVGASLEDNSAGINAGRAYVFEQFDNGTPFDRSDDSWPLTQGLPSTPAPPLQAGDEFGAAVAVDLDTVVVGARVNGPGSVHVYYRNCAGPGWIAGPILVDPAGVTGDHFGAAVAIDGQTLVDRKSTRLNSSHCALSRMPSSA